MNTWLILDPFQQLMHRGGPVLWVILVVLASGWALVLERYLFLLWGYPRQCRALVAASAQGPRPQSWAGARYQEALISQAGQALRRGLPTLRTIVAICPLLGLLGTVFGMLEVFETMAVLGAGNPRAMANGVSQATLSTMAGMIAALSLVYFPFNLEQQARNAQTRLAGALQQASPAQPA